MKIHNYFIAALSFLLLAGCSSQQLFDVRITGEEKDYYMGKEVVSYSDQEAKTILNFEYQEGGFFVFYLHTENTSDKTWEIYPEQIYMEIKEGFDDEAGEKIIYNFAVDPEREIEAIENEMEEREEKHDVSTATNCLFGIFSVVHDLSNDEEDNDIGMGWAGGILRENDEYQYDMDELYASKQFWQNEVLRITTLHPGDKIGGLVYIPLSAATRRFEIHIPLNKTVHIYSFRQIRKTR